MMAREGKARQRIVWENIMTTHPQRRKLPIGILSLPKTSRTKGALI
jgi:hypothetical protein